jgi:hypothetical protein
MPEYNAITGRELKAILLREIESAMNEVFDFTSDAITLPVVRWTWNIRCDVYPRTPQTIELERVGSRISTDATPEEMTSTQPYEMQGANAIGASGMLAPDEAREQAGLPVPTLRSNKRMGTAYHEMVTPTPTDEENWTPPGVRAAVLDKGGPRLRDKK